jgi:hypothetical protein
MSEKGRVLEWPRATRRALGMTVAQAYTVLRYRPVFGNQNQIQARDLLRLAEFLKEKSDYRSCDVRNLTREEIEDALETLGFCAETVLAQWGEEETKRLVGEVQP